MNNDFYDIVGFQWDKGNVDKNLIAHKVENWECEQVFFNEPLLILDDPKHSTTEKRWAAFGRTNAGRLLVAIFTIRSKMIRIISAREMNRKEKAFYEETK
jgi:uncharacterized DUF497 family protein